MQNLTPEQLAQLQQLVEQTPKEELEKQLPQKQQCPYCLISQGQIKATTIYEDPDFIAALEIRPANPGHVILFPKQHLKDLKELNPLQKEKLFDLISKILMTMENLSEGSTTLMHTGIATNISFNHFMVHIIPRFKDDNINLLWQPKEITEEQLKKLQEALKKAFIIEKPIIKETDIKTIKRKLTKPEKRIPR